jgi:hypothetical protein
MPCIFCCFSFLSPRCVLWAQRQSGTNGLCPLGGSGHIWLPLSKIDRISSKANNNRRPVFRRRFEGSIEYYIFTLPSGRFGVSQTLHLPCMTVPQQTCALLMGFIKSGSGFYREADATGVAATRSYSFSWSQGGDGHICLAAPLDYSISSFPLDPTQ